MAALRCALAVLAATLVLSHAAAAEPTGEEPLPVLVGGCMSTVHDDLSSLEVCYKEHVLLVASDGTMAFASEFVAAESNETLHVFKEGPSFGLRVHVRYRCCRTATTRAFPSTRLLKINSTARPVVVSICAAPVCWLEQRRESAYVDRTTAHTTSTTTAGADVLDSELDPDLDLDLDGDEPATGRRGKGQKLGVGDARRLRDEVEELFEHAFDSYMHNAWPMDELKPISCEGELFEPTAGNMLTLVDSLDTLALMGNVSMFHEGVQLVIDSVPGFDLDANVSVFESNIRTLGGLLSAHCLVGDPDLYPDTAMASYGGELLRLAVDLADRLLPAFDTTTGIPYGTVNLRHGVPVGETTVASTAGAGSISLEFTFLSHLVGDARYAKAANSAVDALFHRRSKIGLLGKHIDIDTGKWTEVVSGVGSNSDSFYEYLLKSYVAFGNSTILHMFQTTYQAMRQYSRRGPFYADVDMRSGRLVRSHADGLGAFWPGMEIGAGYVSDAAWAVNAHHRVWAEVGFFPELFNFDQWEVVAGEGKRRYLLRPELVESTYLLLQATNDHSWLLAAEQVVESLRGLRHECGVPSVEDVAEGALRDSMPSFFLGETLKYLYLTFDWAIDRHESHPVLSRSDHVFTTEAHLLPVGRYWNGQRVGTTAAPGVDVRNYDPASDPEMLPPEATTAAAAADTEPVHTEEVRVDTAGTATVRPSRVRWGHRRPRHLHTELWLADHCVGAHCQCLARLEPVCVQEPWYHVQWFSLHGELGTPFAIATQQAESLDAELAAAAAEVAAGQAKPQQRDNGTPSSVQLPGLGAFQVLHTLDRAWIRHEETGEEVEIASLDSRQVLAVIRPVEGELYTLTADQFGHSVACSVTAEGHDGVGVSTAHHDCVAGGFGRATLGPFDTGMRRLVLAPDRKHTGCEEYGAEEAGAEIRGAVLLVWRGGCAFQTKVQHAASAGAAGVVVANNHPGSAFMIMAGTEPTGAPVGSTLSLWDDDLSLPPAALVSRRAGQDLQALAAIGGSVRLAALLHRPLLHHSCAQPARSDGPEADVSGGAWLRAGFAGRRDGEAPSEAQGASGAGAPGDVEPDASPTLAGGCQPQVLHPSTPALPRSRVAPPGRGGATLTSNADTLTVHAGDWAAVFTRTAGERQLMLVPSYWSYVPSVLQRVWLARSTCSVRLDELGTELWGKCPRQW